MKSEVFDMPISVRSPLVWEQSIYLIILWYTLTRVNLLLYLLLPFAQEEELEARSESQRRRNRFVSGRRVTQQVIL